MVVGSSNTLRLHRTHVHVLLEMRRAYSWQMIGTFHRFDIQLVKGDACLQPVKEKFPHRWGQILRHTACMTACHADCQKRGDTAAVLPAYGIEWHRIEASITHAGRGIRCYSVLICGVSR
jgi:hypothetical protein